MDFIESSDIPELAEQAQQERIKEIKSQLKKLEKQRGKLTKDIEAAELPLYAELNAFKLQAFQAKYAPLIGHWFFLTWPHKEQYFQILSTHSDSWINIRAIEITENGLKCYGPHDTGEMWVRNATEISEEDIRDKLREHLGAVWNLLGDQDDG